MKYRKLRIAWSVAWGVVAVLLCVLWVRSYWIEDVIYRLASGRRWQAISYYGHAFLAHAHEGGNALRYHETPIEKPEAFKYIIPDPQISFLGVQYKSKNNFTFIVLPFWVPILSCITIGGSIWFSWRYSLRTLLIATTIVAAVLGLIVWMSRAG